MRVLANPILSVDSFFVLSGCLLAYITFKEMDRSGGKINLVLFYLHRYIRYAKVHNFLQVQYTVHTLEMYIIVHFRITGVYAFVIGFYASLYKFLDYGILSSVDFIVDQCQANWWRNLLYINNISEQVSYHLKGHAIFRVKKHFLNLF